MVNLSVGLCDIWVLVFRSERYKICTTFFWDLWRWDFWLVCHCHVTPVGIYPRGENQTLHIHTYWLGTKFFLSALHRLPIKSCSGRNIWYSNFSSLYLFLSTVCVFPGLKTTYIRDNNLECVQVKLTAQSGLSKLSWHLKEFGSKHRLTRGYVWSTPIILAQIHWGDSLPGQLGSDAIEIYEYHFELNVARI